MLAGLDSDGSQWGFNKWELLKICQVWYKLTKIWKVMFSNIHKRIMKWPLFIMYPRNCPLYVKIRIFYFPHCIKVKPVFHLQKHNEIICVLQKTEEGKQASCAPWLWAGLLLTIFCWIMRASFFTLFLSFSWLSLDLSEFFPELFWDWVLSSCFYVLDCVCLCVHSHTQSVCIASIWINT